MNMRKGSRVIGAKGPRARGRASLGSGQRPLNPSAPRPLGPSGFTLIELLIVITVIGVLIAVIGLVGVKVAHQQRVTLTETIMRNVKLAIDQFKENNPLANIYDRKDAATFGPYPPYMLAGGTGGTVPPANTVAQTLEPPISYGNFGYVLGDRLHRDLGNRTGIIANWVSWGTVDPNDANLDIRALYVYLKLFAPDALAQVPTSALKPLSSTPEYVNPSGLGTAAGTSGLTDVLGIYDAWGVPLDYFLYVKLEYTLLPGGSAGWRVAERIPALRSFGISREEYDLEIKQQDELDPQLWIFSDPFPSPAANRSNATFWQTGTFVGPNTSESGWARAVGAGDLNTASVPRQAAFGYVP